MKNSLILLVVLLFTYLSNAQEQHKEYYDNGNLKAVGQYNADGYQTGVWKYYREDGSGILKFSINKDNNMVTHYYDSSNKVLSVREINPETGKYNGKVKSYYINGKLKSVGSSNGIDQTGAWKWYYENGQLKSIGNFNEEGKKIGEWKTYYENGKLKTLENYEENKKIGRWSAYYENGQLKTLENYEEGKKTGEWKEYYENGQLSGAYIYDKGKLMEFVSKFNKDGKNLTKGDLINGNGSFYVYENDKHIETRIVKNGRLTHVLYGQILPNIDLKTLDDVTINTASFHKKGKPFILIFWAEWCGPCKEQLKEYSEYYTELQKELDLDIIIVSTYNKGENYLDKVKIFINDNSIKFNFFIDKNNELSKALELNSIPDLLVIDEEHKIIYGSQGWRPNLYQEKLEEIKKALKE